MYCSECGNEILAEHRFCNTCGKEVNQERLTSNDLYESTMNNQYVDNQYVDHQFEADSANHFVSLGYSERIHDPAFKKYINNANNYALIFTFAIAIIAVIGFFIAGEVSNELDNPESLFIGFAIGGMFLVIGLFQVISKKTSKTWDGQIVDKKIEHKKKRVNTGDDDYYMQKYILYRVIIKSTSGKKHEIQVENDDTVYNYYQIGDYIRHHAGLNSYEKYDKTKDTIIFCSACAVMHSIEEEFCRKCKCPLLK